MDDLDVDLYTNIIEETAAEVAKTIDQEIIWDILKADCLGWYEFSVPWTDKIRAEDWNEICAWVVEQFGLPGDRYVTHPNTDEMKFLFKNAKDYEWMVLRWS